MRSTEDLAKELFARKEDGRYDRALIVTCYDRDDLDHFTFVKAEDRKMSHSDIMQITERPGLTSVQH